MINLKIILNKIVSDNNIYYLLLMSVILFYSSIYVLSFIKVVNFWSYSQSFMNYSEGFIKRGMFGTLILFFENYFNITPRTFFSSFFVFFYSLNIFLFFSLLKKYSQNILLLIFLALSPTLIMFPYNDLGGYQRLDVLSISAILTHSLIAQKFYNREITFKKYNTILNFLVFPFIFISILFHEIQIISLPFHFFLSLKISDLDIKYNIKKYILFLIPVFCILFLYPDENSLKKLEEIANNRGIWNGAFLFHSKNIGMGHYIYEFKTNVLILYNFKIHLIMILLATIPFYFILFYFDKNKYLLSPLPVNYLFMTLSVLPFLAGLLIGDFGRWVNIMSFVAFGFLAQFPLKKKLENFKFFNKNLFKQFINLILLSIIIFYLFFIRIPHCCNLEKHGINLYGGIVKKSIAVVNVVFNSSNNMLYNLDNRFND